MAELAPEGVPRWESMVIVPRELSFAGRVDFVTTRLHDLKACMAATLVEDHRSVELCRPRVTFIPKAEGASLEAGTVRRGDLLAVLSVPYVRR